MGSTVESAAAAVKSLLDSKPQEGGDSLVAFAERFAVTPKLKHKAVILQLNHGSVPQGDGRRDIERQMLELVDAIVEDHRSRAEIFQKRNEARKRTQERLSQEPPPDDVVVAAEGLEKSYPGTDFRLAGLDLELRLGEITGVVGQNAHGKTTLLRMLAGELLQDAGRLSYPALGQEQDKIDWVRVKSEIAYLPQELPPWRGSLEDSLRYEAALHGILGADNDREVEFISERLGLAEHLAKSWRQLSGGYKLRFALAAVLVWKPRLLIMDEPLANLDVRAQTNLLQDIRDLARSYRHPMAVLLSSQHLHEVEAVSQRIVFLREGSVVFAGPRSEIGTDREYNAYELGTSLSLSDLSKSLPSGLAKDLHFDGVNFVLKTRRETSYRDVLTACLEHGVDVEYFRDISRSTKQLFE